MEIIVKEWDEERLIRQAASLVVEQARQKIDEVVEEEIRAVVEGRVEELVGAEIQKVLDKVLADGWQPTDRWGAATGERVDLHTRVSQRVTQYLDTKVEYERKTVVEKLVDDAVAAELKGETGKALQEARAKIREQVDAVLQAKLRSTLAEALGIGGGRG